MCVCVRVHVGVCICVWMWVCGCVHLCVDVGVWVWMCAFVCVNINVQGGFHSQTLAYMNTRIPNRFPQNYMYSELFRTASDKWEQGYFVDV